MKQKILVLILLVVLYVAYIGVRLYFFDTKASGRIRVVSTPEAQVLVNGARVGATPYEGAYPEGAYEVKVVPDRSAQSFLPWAGTVRVYANTLSYVSRELAASDLISAGEIFTLEKNPKLDGSLGELVVESEPSGAIVFLDNDQQGITPLKIANVSADDHELSLYMPGFFRRSLKLKTEKQKTLHATVKLALDQSYKTLVQALEEEKKKASEEAKTKSEGAAENQKVLGVPGEMKLKILDTPTGYLNVRSEAGVSGQIVTTVRPGEEYSFLEDKGGWYKIQVGQKQGWVSGEYIEIQNR